MTMTKTDYETVATGIADCIRQENERHATMLDNEQVLYSHTVKAIEGVARQLAAKFALSHSTFKSNVFLKACGVNTSEYGD